jgi:NAD(P)-dependent dehydrogenase (short-subunit alcohol dehydrogenase family)
MLSTFLRKLPSSLHLKQCARSGLTKIMGNCAGIVGPTNTPILGYPAADYERVYSVNLRGSFLMIN